MNNFDQDQSAVKRVNIALFAAQAAISVGFLSMATVNPIIAEAMGGSKGFAGVPNTMIFLGAALSAYMVGNVINRYGRRVALIIGALAGIAGCIAISASINLWVFPMFLAALFAFGMGRGILDQSRFAAAEVNKPERRAGAISMVVWGGTIGSVIGPQLTEPASQLARSLGLAPLSGPALSAATFAGFSLLLFVFLLAGVDFKAIAKRMEINRSAPVAVKGWPVFTVPRARAAMFTMLCGQSAMALMMTIISVHMKDHNLDLAQVGIVLSAHTLGMFAFSPLVGKFADRIGRPTAILIGAAILMGGCVVTALTLNTPVIALGEFMVGLGWSFCYVAGGALLTNSLAPELRAASQGKNDFIVNMASALGALGSGLLLASIGFYWVCAVGFAVAAIPALAVLRWAPPSRGAPALAPA